MLLVFAAHPSFCSSQSVLDHYTRSKTLSKTKKREKVSVCPVAWEVSLGSVSGSEGGGKKLGSQGEGRSGVTLFLIRIGNGSAARRASAWHGIITGSLFGKKDEVE